MHSAPEGRLNCRIIAGTVTGLSHGPYDAMVDHPGPRLPGRAGNDCFLCQPDEDLIYASDGESLALCGLGPVVPGYSLVATVEHVRSAADVVAGEAQRLASFVRKIRGGLSDRYGQCLLTEHGRVPVCIDVSGTTDPHCYHAHFLLFPGAPDVEAGARGHFARVENASSLDEALALAYAKEEYFLLSPDPERYLVMTRPGRLIRQFVRLLVADSIGRPELASWRRYPSRDEAVATARDLRSRFVSSGISRDDQ